MGKGDKKSKRGKIFQGSYGVRRRKNSEKTVSGSAPLDMKPKEPKDIKEVKEVKAVKETAPVKAPKAAAVVKKDHKPKKQETPE